MLNMAEKMPLKVIMLGDFALHWGSKAVLSGYSRSNKAIYLLQYLLAHRGKSFSRDALIQLLYQRDDTENPVNALKIIVHRLRKLLLSLGLPDQEYILYESGRYSWNSAIHCEVDSEFFDAAVKAAENTELPQEERLSLYQQAISVYSGEFLPGLSTEDWVIPLSLYYQNRYHSSIQIAFQLLEEKSDYEGMLTVSSRAAALFPYDEKIQILKIYSLYRNKQVKEALAAYNATVEMLFNEFGVNPSNELLNLYKEISQGLSDVRDSIGEIRDSIRQQEEDQGQGAYYSNFQNFSDSYHLMVRSLERTGLSAYLMLCTLEDPSDFHSLQTAIKESLRKCDCFTRYSPKQYLILLMGINYENCEIVFRRIEEKFRRSCRGKCFNLDYSVVSAVDTEWMDSKVV